MTLNDFEPDPRVRKAMHSILTGHLLRDNRAEDPDFDYYEAKESASYILPRLQEPERSRLRLEALFRLAKF